MKSTAATDPADRPHRWWQGQRISNLGVDVFCIVRGRGLRHNATRHPLRSHPHIALSGCGAFSGLARLIGGPVWHGLCSSTLLRRIYLRVFGEEGSLTVYTRFEVTAGGNLRAEVTGYYAIGKPCPVRLCTVRGLLLAEKVEDGLDQCGGLKLGPKDEGGESTVPGICFLSADLGDDTVIQKAVLLHH